MAFVLTEEQQFLKDSAKDFLNNKASVSLLRELRDNNDPNGFSQSVWSEMTEMGWTSMIIPESLGGMEFGYLGFGQLFEQIGRNLTSSPLLSSSVIASSLINLTANQVQKENLLGAIAAGKVISLASQEGSHHNEDTPTTSGKVKDDEIVISGKKTYVLNAHVADHLIVSVDLDGETALITIPKDAPGLSIERQKLMDMNYYSTVQLTEVKVSEDQLLAKGKDAQSALKKTFDIANVFLSAELLGLSTEAFERTLAYLKERSQFGKIIGTFQALQHRAAIMFNELEVTKTLILKALEAIDMDNSMLPMLSSMAKAKACKTAQLITNEGIQMFGGIGMTDDEEIGFFLKRARVAMELYGNQSYHVDRYARFMSY